MSYTPIAKDTPDWDVPLNAALTNLDTGKADAGHTHTQAQSHNAVDTDTATTALHHTLGTGANQAAAGNHTHIQSQSHISPDTDAATTSLHHTLGTGATQAAAGNHTHTIANFTSVAAGLVPASGGGTTNFLRADGSFAAPPSTSQFTSSTAGTVPASGGGTSNFMRADGSWAVPPGTGGGSGSHPEYVNVKTDYGAAGDAKYLSGSITSGSNVLTQVSGPGFVAGDVGKTVIVENGGGTGIPLVATISSRTTTTATLSASASATVTGGTCWFGTNDTTAFQNARDDVVNNAVLYSNGDRICQKAMYIPTGYYIVTSQDALLSSPASPTILRNFCITGDWGARGTLLIFATSVSSTADPTQGNLITAGNRLRGAKFQFFTVRSCNQNQGFMYLYCDTSSGSPYGSGAQNDIVYDTVNLKGAWNRGWGLDGGTSANLNSEMVWRRCYVDDSTTFQTAIVHSGVTPPTSGGDQFVNYVFDHCYFEFTSGDALRYDYGGHITVIGGSWILGINSGVGNLFSFPNHTHQFYTKHLTVIGTRFELRNSSCKILDSYWTGSTTHVTFQGTTNVSNSSGNNEAYTINATSTSVGNYRFLNCEIGGYVKYVATAAAAANLGKIVFDQCNFNDNSAGGVGTASGALRYNSTFIPNYKFVDCYNFADLP